MAAHRSGSVAERAVRPLGLGGPSCLRRPRRTARASERLTARCSHRTVWDPRVSFFQRCDAVFFGIRGPRKSRPSPGPVFHRPRARVAL
eukprot:8723092-Pyramimonas_sp.AAC.1